MGPGAGSRSLGLAWLALACGVLWSSQAARQTPPPGFRFASYEVIIPRRMAPPRGREPQDLTYLMEVEGNGHVVHLRQKRGFLPKHFPVFTYSNEGDLHVDYPFIRDDCFYHGFVEGLASSLAALSTCSGGFRGLLQVGNAIYEIEPIQASDTFQHIVYQLEEQAGALQMRCGLTWEEQSRQKAMIQVPENVVSRTKLRGHARYAKIAVVVEHECFIQFGKNVTITARYLLDAAHIADSLYMSLGIHVVMVGLEIWSQKNLITVVKNLDEVLDVFNTWRRQTFTQRLRHDVAHLVVYKHFGVNLGLSFVGTACNPVWSSAVEALVSSSLFSFTITFAHQLGHNLGIQHDEKHCTCSQHSCIMAPLQSYVSKFSNCSHESYSKLMNYGRKQCLLIPPEHEKLFEFKNCGNKVVESGEQCDCGSIFDCRSDACCQTNCMLRSGATCALGKCCGNCQFLPAGTVCRESTNMCDLPEYCTGISEWCPEDVYIQDGASCYDGAYCYHGKCSTHDQQCRTIFGNQATAAPRSCFKEINTRGDRFGNCGIIPGNIYKTCENTSILCGRIQCQNVDELPNLNERSTVVQISRNNLFCWGTRQAEMGIVDVGAVRDGTRCGHGMICVNGDCIKVSLLNYDCNQTKCHNRGVCNSYKQCHCNYGWAPPYCLNEGLGGSINSGPPPPNSGNIRMATSVVMVAAVIVPVGKVGIL